MFTIVYGTDTVGVRNKARSLMAVYVDQGHVPQELSSENYESGAIRDFAQGQSLFTEKHVLLLDMQAAPAELLGELMLYADALGTSTNAAVVIFESLLAEHKKKISPHASEVIEVARVARKEANPFAFADAFTARDKKQLWTLLQDARREGRSAEETIGTLFWQIKMMRLAQYTNSPEEAGQKSFVYQKAKRALSKFKTGELDRLSRELVELYHDGHAGKSDIDLSLERWILSL